MSALAGSAGPYTQQERVIFRYFNGTAEVAADPLMIDLALREAAGGRLNAMLKAYNDTSHTEEEWAGPMRQLIEVAQKAFTLSFDPNTGKPMAYLAWAALSSFLEWQEKNAQPAASSQTGSRPLDSTPNSAPSLSPNMSR
jgi:hypothetical protein